MAKLTDPWDHHDWSSKEYVSAWAERQDEREVDREAIFHLIARTLSEDSRAALTILDLGAGYGALAQFLLEHFPNAKAVCQDGSAEMAKLGRNRMEHLKGVSTMFCLTSVSPVGAGSSKALLTPSYRQ
jgi:16S rRNA G1207 methylase RsmC